MRTHAGRLATATLLLAASCVPASRQSPVHTPAASSAFGAARPALPGPQPDGSVLLPNQWSLRPVGTTVELRDFPINIAVHPAGRYAAVLHSGYSRHQILVVDVIAAEVVSHVDVNQAFYGLEFSPDGTALFCSGAGEEVIHAFTFREGTLSGHRQLRLREITQRGVPAGLAVNDAATRLYVANVWAHRVTSVELLPEPKFTDIPIGTNAAEAQLYNYNPEDTFPYACRLDEKRQRLYVSLWAQAAVAVMDLRSGQTIARWPAEDHPSEMALARSGRFLFVANAARNTVTLFNTETGKAIETIHAALYPNAPSGSTPNSLALSPDERTLLIANADNNIVAVFDVRTPGKSRSLGFIPVGWYPTSVRVTPDGKRLLVANGKGHLPKANPQGPQPGVNNTGDLAVQYIARLLRGTLSIIDLPPRPQFEQQLAAYTRQAYLCSPLTPKGVVSAARPADSPIPGKPGESCPIRYCLYIIKENRTYDQVLGDMPQGNGDSNLCLFPERVTPNHHKLARDFVLLDNFYVESEVSADGHEWSMAAYATDFVEKMWPLITATIVRQRSPTLPKANSPLPLPQADIYGTARARRA